jgi:hypothetical protein
VPAGRLERVALVAVGPRPLAGVYEGLVPLPAQGVLEMLSSVTRSFTASPASTRSHVLRRSSAG